MIVSGSEAPALDATTAEAAWYLGFQQARATYTVNEWNWQEIWETAMRERRDSGGKPAMVKIGSFSEIVGEQFKEESDEEYHDRIAAMDRAANAKASDYGSCAILTDEALFFYLS